MKLHLSTRWVSRRGPSNSSLKRVPASTLVTKVCGHPPPEALTKKKATSERRITDPTPGASSLDQTGNAPEQKLAPEMDEATVSRETSVPTELQGPDNANPRQVALRTRNEAQESTALERKLVPS